MILMALCAEIASAALKRVAIQPGPGAEARLRTALALYPAADSLELQLLPGDYFFNHTLIIDSALLAERTWLALRGQGKVRFLGSRVENPRWQRESEGLWSAKIQFPTIMRNVYVADSLALPGRKYVESNSDDGGYFIPVKRGFLLQDKGNSLGLSAMDLLGAELWGLDQWRLFGGKVQGVVGDTLLLEASNLLYWSKQWQGSAWFRRVNWIQNHKAFVRNFPDWFYEKKQNKFYLAVQSSQAPISQINLGVLSTLVRVDGIPGSNSTRVIFAGIEFTQTGWQGHQDYFITHQVKHVLQGSAKHLPAAFEASFINGLIVENCIFRDLGANALFLQRGVQNSIVRKNQFYRLAGSAVVLGKTADDRNVAEQLAQEFQQTRNILVEQNNIRQVGMLYTGSVGIFVGWGQQIELRENTLENLPYSGISLGWGWGMHNYSRHNQIINNRVLDVCKNLRDGGAIYLLGWQGEKGAGPIVRGNTVLRWHGYAGIYLDNGVQHAMVDGNRVQHGTSGHWLHVQNLSPPALHNVIGENDTLPGDKRYP